ncbi:uncharacterized protein LOC111317240 [Durio zibethinus]|uniref:Uncharacterized protein LOC111317240 n=1 Tax=Durio zibethinus TaxID=66656 RepID=A0A6P6BE71_DURZI|nr:uncharacterized protein LOC111317240 [Durio zibethinus]
MDTSILQSFASKSPPSTNPVLPKASSSARTYTQVCTRRYRRFVKVCCTNSSADNNGSSSTSGSDAPPPIRPPETVGIRFKRGSRRRRKLQEDGFEGGQRMAAKAAVDPTPKKWEEMSITEKAIELYVGEKGLLFWLNKFAYASIFIVIGAWILFRFVGPALNLYQLDSPPLSPTSMFKGS